MKDEHRAQQKRRKNQYKKNERRREKWESGHSPVVRRFRLESSGIGIALPYIVLYEVVALMVVGLMRYYGHPGMADILRNTFTFVVGVVVGFMDTILFQVGLNKYEQACACLYERVMHKIVDFSAQVRMCVQVVAVKEGPDPCGPGGSDEDEVAARADAALRLAALVRALPYACKHAVMSSGWREKTSRYPSFIRTLEIPPSITIREEAFCAEAPGYEKGVPPSGIERNQDALMSFEHVSLDRLLFPHLDASHDHLRDLLRRCEFELQCLEWTGAVPNGPCYDRCLSLLYAVEDGVRSAQSVYAAEVPYIYRTFIGVVVHLYVLVVPVMFYTLDYWWIVLVLYPLLVYLFVAPHLIGLRLCRAMDYGRKTTYLPATQWCRQVVACTDDNFQEVHRRLTR